MRRAPAVFVWLVVALAPGHAARDDDGLPPFIVLQREAPSERRLRGDFEAPDAVLVSFSELWPEALSRLVRASLLEGPVYLLVDPELTTDDELTDWVIDYGLTSTRLNVLWADVDTPWVRDYGPLQVTEGDTSLWLDARYDTQRPGDDVVPSVLGRELGVETQPLDVDLDGGGLISNGAGLCAATLEHVFASGVEIDDAAARQALLERLGCRELVLVPALAADETRHIDMFAQFLGPDLVAVASVEPPSIDGAIDALHLEDAVNGLVAAAQLLGQSLRVVRVPLPYLGGGNYRPYLNGLHLQRSFIVPSYGDVAPEVEAMAQAALQSAMPGVALVPVPADAMIALNGALHCVSLGLALPKTRDVVAARRIHQAPGRL